MLGRTGECLLGCEYVTDDIGAKNVLERNGVACCWHVGSGNLAHRRDDVDNLAKFAGEVFNLAHSQVDSSESRKVAHGFSRDVRHGHKFTAG